MSAHPPPAGDELLSLQEAADRLKVHYMTAYRWVRRGDLPAYKTGGRLRVRLADLTAFVADRAVELALPEPEGRTQWPAHVDRLEAALRDGDTSDANALVRRVIAHGATAGDVYLHLLTPALHRIGTAWAEGRIGVAEEHRATEIVGALMGRLGEGFRRRGPSRGVAVTLTPVDDLHALGAAMVADFLRAGGFEVHHLGPNVPADDLAAFLDRVDADVVAVSVTGPGHDPAELRRLVVAARRSRDRVVVFGGQAVTPALAMAAGARHIGDLRALAGQLADADRPKPPDA